MPTYEYVCEKCGHEFEASQSMAAAPLKICPKEVCKKKVWGRGRVKKKISSGGGLIFKGSGFYITDYKKKSSSPAKEGGKENVKSPPSASSAKTSD